MNLLYKPIALLGTTLVLSGLISQLSISSSLPNVQFRAQVAMAQTAEDFYNQGKEKFLQRNYREAIEDFNQALQINSADVKTYVVRGFTRYLLRGNHSRTADVIGVLATGVPVMCFV
jgi:tetratricopeptide (TPR) repeat protein